MKATGIVRRLDELGRVVLPKEMRRTFNINEGDTLEIFTNENDIILKKYTPGCSCCDNINGLIEVNGVKICTSCLEKFNNKVK